MESMDCSIDTSLSLTLPGTKKSSPVSSDKLSTTSSLNNLDLNISLDDSCYSSVAREEIQETLDSDKQLAIVNPDQIPFTFIPTSDPEDKAYYFFFDGIADNVDEPVIKEEEQEVLQIEGPQPLPLAQVLELEKVLKPSDVNHCSRLMIPKQYVQENVMPFLSEAEREEVVNGNGGMNVIVYDDDTESEHIVQFKLWKSSRCYVFTGWSGEFKKRRSLKVGDTISLSWYQNRFSFSVLQRAH